MVFAWSEILQPPMLYIVATMVGAVVGATVPLALSHVVARLRSKRFVHRRC